MFSSGTVYFKSGEDKYYPEELLAIVLNKSRELAEDFAGRFVLAVMLPILTLSCTAQSLATGSNPFRKVVKKLRSPGPHSFQNGNQDS